MERPSENVRLYFHTICQDYVSSSQRVAFYIGRFAEGKEATVTIDVAKETDNDEVVSFYAQYYK